MSNRVVSARLLVAEHGVPDEKGDVPPRLVVGHKEEVEHLLYQGHLSSLLKYTLHRIIKNHNLDTDPDKLPAELKEQTYLDTDPDTLLAELKYYKLP